MLIASIPTKISVPFADSAGGGFTRPIPIPSQIGIQAGAASFTDGFPPVTFLPIGAGGTPPWGADFNGLLNQMSAWLRWTQAGAPIAYDATFQTDIGGYPLGALVASTVTAGLYWFSTVDGNATNPDASGAGWIPVNLGNGGVLTTGAWTWRPTQEVIPGWTKANGTTIGNTGSGASQLADPTAFNQFKWLWDNFSNSQCPVSTGRGANATADFAALKTITVLNMQGMAPVGMDTMGGAPSTRLTGVPVTSGSATQSGSVLGENLHALIIAELAAHGHTVIDPTHLHAYVDPTHSHSASFPQSQANQFGTSAFGAWSGTTSVSTTASATNITILGAGTGISLGSTGSGTPHNTVALSMTGTHYFKL